MGESLPYTMTAIMFLNLASFPLIQCFHIEDASNTTIPILTSAFSDEQLNVSCGDTIRVSCYNPNTEGKATWYRYQLSNLSNETVRDSTLNLMHSISTYKIPVEYANDTTSIGIWKFITPYDAGWYSCIGNTTAGIKVLQSFRLQVNCNGGEGDEQIEGKIREIEQGKGLPYSSRLSFMIKNNASQLTVNFEFNALPTSNSAHWIGEEYELISEADNSYDFDHLRLDLNANQLKYTRKFTRLDCNLNGCAFESFSVKKSEENGTIELKEINPGRNVFLICSFDIKTSWSYEWTIHNRTGKSILLSESKNEDSSTLQVIGLSYENQGMYECTAYSSGINENKTCRFQLKLVNEITENQTQFSTVPTERSTVVKLRKSKCHNNTKLFCDNAVSGSRVKWYHPPKEIQRGELINSTYLMKNFEVESNFYAARHLGLYLELIRTSFYDTGWYSCLDRYNEVMSTTWLEVGCDEEKKNEYMRDQQLQRIRSGAGEPYIIRTLLLFIDGKHSELYLYGVYRAYPKPVVMWWATEIDEKTAILRYRSEMAYVDQSEISTREGPTYFTYFVCNANGCTKGTYPIYISTEQSQVKSPSFTKYKIAVHRNITLACEFISAASSWRSQWVYYQGNMIVKWREETHERSENFTYFPLDEFDRAEGVFECAMSDTFRNQSRIFHLKIIDAPSKLPDEASKEDAILITWILLTFSLTVGVIFCSSIAYCGRKRNLFKKSRSGARTEMDDLIQIKQVVIRRTDEDASELQHLAK